MDPARNERNPALKKAYDSDVVRRSAMSIEPWRTHVVEGWLTDVPETAQLLELGAGTGQMAAHVRNLGYEVTAIDLSPGNVAAAVQRRVPAQVADFAELPFTDACFGAAFAINSLLHVPRSELPGIYSELRRVLSSGAPVLIVVWGGEDHQGPVADEWLDPPRYFNFFSDEGMWEQPTPGFDKVGLHTVDEATAENLRAQVLTLVAV